MSTQWFYKRNGQQCGPVSATELKSLADAGQLAPSDKVWREGLRGWVEAGRVKTLFATVGHVSTSATAIGNANAPRGDPVAVPGNDLKVLAEIRSKAVPSASHSLLRRYWPAVLVLSVLIGMALIFSIRGVAHSISAGGLFRGGTSSSTHAEDWIAFLHDLGYGEPQSPPEGHALSIYTVRAAKYGSREAYETAARHGEFSLRDLYEKSEGFRSKLAHRSFYLEVAGRQSQLEAHVTNWRDGKADVVATVPFELDKASGLPDCRLSQVSYFNPAFLTKRGTLQPCDPRLVPQIRMQDGIIYFKRSSFTTITISLPMPSEEADSYSLMRSGGELKVRCIFRGVTYLGPDVVIPRHVLYYREKALDLFGSDALDAAFDVGSNGSPEVPDVFETVTTDTTDYVRATLIGWDIVGNNGKVLDHQRAPDVPPVQQSGVTYTPPAQPMPAARSSANSLPSRVGDTWTNSLGMKFAYIPPGTFQMGSPASEAGRGKDETQHQVTLTRGFLIQTTPVTQAQWQAVMGTGITEQRNKEIPSWPLFGTGDDYPMYYISRDEAQEYCRKLSAMEGKHYRLPTEAQWEYACRAGSTSRYYFGDNENQLGKYGWYSGNSGNQTHPVGQKKPNAWGLYDMSGNVCQWCSDWYRDYPAGAATGQFFVLRGGSWRDGPEGCRSACRFGYSPGTRDGGVGFRVVLDLFE